MCVYIQHVIILYLSLFSGTVCRSFLWAFPTGSRWPAGGWVEEAFPISSIGSLHTAASLTALWKGLSFYNISMWHVPDSKWDTPFFLPASEGGDCVKLQKVLTSVLCLWGPQYLLAWCGKQVLWRQWNHVSESNQNVSKVKCSSSSLLVLWYTEKHRIKLSTALDKAPAANYSLLEQGH